MGFNPPWAAVGAGTVREASVAYPIPRDRKRTLRETAVRGILLEVRVRGNLWNGYHLAAAYRVRFGEVELAMGGQGNR